MRTANTTKLAMLGILLLGLGFLLLPTLLRDAPFSVLSFEVLRAEQSGDLSTPHEFLISFIPGGFLYVPLVLGILNLLLGYVILRKHFDEKDSLIFLLLAVCIPTFIVAHTFGNPFSSIFFLNLLGVFFFQRKSYVLATLPYVALVFFGPLAFVSSALLLYLYNRKRDALVGRVLFAPILVFLLTLFTLQTISLPLAFNPKNILSEAGSRSSVGIFSLVIAGVGWLSHWRKKKYVLIGCGLFLVGAVFLSSFNYFLYLVVVVLGGIGIRKLIYAKWSSDTLKHLTLFILLLGIIFTIVSYEKEIITTQPSGEVVLGLEFLSQQEKGVVFTHESRAMWVESIALQDTRSNLVVEHSYDFEFVQAYFDQHHVKYLFFDESLWDGDVWESPNQELLFLLQDRRYFNLIYQNGDVRIWEYRS